MHFTARQKVKPTFQQTVSEYRTQFGKIEFVDCPFKMAIERGRASAFKFFRTIAILWSSTLQQVAKHKGYVSSACAYFK